MPSGSDHRGIRITFRDKFSRADDKFSIARDKFKRNSLFGASIGLREFVSGGISRVYGSKGVLVFKVNFARGELTLNHMVWCLNKNLNFD